MLTSLIPDGVYGDIAFLDDHRLYVCGRLRSVIIVRGVNHNLEDLERTASSAHSKLTAYPRVAISTQGDDGENVAILHEAPLFLRKDAVKQELEQEISDLILKNHGFCAREIRLVPAGSLPRTRSGKIDRKAADKLLSDGSFI
ncbi:hypothetical protein [uncultured Erythrobacter sp.]|uniref:hypothetical protein n=1 Tax=uncultured Erythrobacter sp. TaxID=263913 RepID=UPI0026245987|nr:hypothetical protein [uncultured Erythrobacter sp.]